MVLEMRKMKDSGIEWIGEIPEGWEVSKLKYLGRYVNGYPFKPDDWGDKGKPIIRIQDLTGSNDSPNYYDGDIDAKYHIKNGDILVSWAATLDAFIWNKGDGLLNQHIFKAIPQEEKITSYFFFWMIKEAMQNMNNDNKHGIFMQHVTLDVFNNFPVPLPPLSEQKRIATYLFQKISKADIMLDDTLSSITGYKKLKQAVITQAVTKGVRGEREMKDSGVEWIGEIPAEWSVQRIKTIFSIRNERNYLPLEQVNLISLYTDKGVVQHCDIEKTTGNKASNADGYKKVYPNDMIVNIILCWMGAIGRSNYAGVTSPAYDVYVPSSKIECKFYHYYFRTLGFSGDCYKNGRGIMAMRWRTYSDQFRSIKVVVPPLEEQKEIVGYLDAKCAEIDGLIAKKEQLIKELESYKKSLIYEVVTGKREV